MKLLTKEVISKLEKSPLRSQDAKQPGEVPIIVKFFTPWTNWTWYVVESNAVLSDGRDIPLDEARHLCSVRDTILPRKTPTPTRKNHMRNNLPQHSDSKEQAAVNVELLARQTESQLEGRSNAQLGIHIHSETGTSACDGERIRQACGLSVSEKIEASSEEIRTRTSQEPQSWRRPTEEFAGDDTKSPQQTAPTGSPESQTLKVTDYIFYGMVHGHEHELGYFLLSDLESIRGPFGLKIERDMHFYNKTLADVQ